MRKPFFLRPLPRNVRRKESFQPRKVAAPVRGERQHGHAQPRGERPPVQPPAPLLQKIFHRHDEHGAPAEREHFADQRKGAREGERVCHAHREVVISRHDLFAGDLLFEAVRFERIDAGQVEHLRAHARKLCLPAAHAHRDAVPVARLCMPARERIEEGGFAAVRVADEQQPREGFPRPFRPPQCGGRNGFFLFPHALRDGRKEAHMRRTGRKGDPPRERGAQREAHPLRVQHDAAAEGRAAQDAHPPPRRKVEHAQPLRERGRRVRREYEIVPAASGIFRIHTYTICGKLPHYAAPRLATRHTAHPCTPCPPVPCAFSPAFAARAGSEKTEKKRSACVTA